MRLDRALSVFLTRTPLGRGVLRTPRLPILMYHSIANGEDPRIAPYYRLTTSPARFREQMQRLRNDGHAVITLTDAVGLLAGSALDHRRHVVLTFDDGYRDFMTSAWPVLADLGFPATVFLPTGFIGDVRRAFKGRECLTWSEVRQLAADGVTFGAHTVSHPVLTSLPWAEIQRELRDSRAHIEDAIHAPTTAFAYPYAFPQEDRRFVDRLKEELAASGYTAGVTTAVGRAAPRDDCLALRRLPVNDVDDPPLFVSKLSGTYDWVGRLQAAYRHSRQGFRRLRASPAA